MIILIPAYEPGDSLTALVSALLACDVDAQVLVVDDGSGERFASVFAAARSAGAEVLTHIHNRGKGAALKTGFAHVLARYPDDDVITADSDGQHTVTDILRVADELRTDAVIGEPVLVLGCRSFSGSVPARSRIGNTIARGLFRSAAGWALSDTQTGLRGIPAPLLEWHLAQPGDRFEYELTVLLHAHRSGIATRELPIDTVYLERNASSHFRPVIDSLRVMVPLVLFAGSSLISFAVDTVALLVLNMLSGWLIPSIIAARVLSAGVNFTLNRRYVFDRSAARVRSQAVRYAVLAFALLASNIAWMAFLTDAGMPLLLAKIATEIVLFVISYGVQRSFVFGSAERVDAPKTAHSNRIDAPGAMKPDITTPTRSTP